MTEKNQTALERALDILPEPDEDASEIKDLTKVVDTNDDNIDVDTALVDLYTRAIDAFEEQVNNASIVEPRFAARNMEVAKGLLDSAMEAIKLRQRKEEHADKIDIARNKKDGPRNQTNNILVADRNDVLREMMGGNTRDNPHRKETLVMEPNKEEG